jgi:hypothetical protein
LNLDFRFFSLGKGAKMQSLKGAEKKALQTYFFVKFTLIFEKILQRNLLAKTQSRKVLFLSFALFEFATLRLCETKNSIP